MKYDYVHKIIQDEDKLESFIEWLPDLQSNEKFYVSLMARKKYDRTIKKDKAQLKRFVSSKKDLFNKISQLEIPIGCYQFDGQSINQEALALYISPNPRNMRLATANAIMEFSKVLYKNFDNFNPVSSILTAAHRSGSRSVYVDFDFDGVELDGVLEKIQDKINFDALSVLRTKGGFHLLVEVQKVNPQYKKWHQSISSVDGCDVRGDSDDVPDDDRHDCLMPVPGTTQGGFMPYLENL